MHGEEIGRVVHLGDKREFIGERALHLLRHARWIAPRRAVLGKGFERRLRRRIAFAQFLWIFVFEIGEREVETFEKAQALRDGLRRFGEKPLHLRAAFQMPFGIGLHGAADGLERRVAADGGQHILQRPPRRLMHQHVIGGEQRQIKAARQRGAFGQSLAHMRPIGHACGEPDAAGRGLMKLAEKPVRISQSRPGPGRLAAKQPGGVVREILIDLARLEVGRRRLPTALREDSKLQARGGCAEIVCREPAETFLALHIAVREEAREPRISRAVLRIGENVRRAVAKTRRQPVTTRKACGAISFSRAKL